MPDGERKVEIRQGAPDGEKIGEIRITGTGGWDKWQEFRTDLKPTFERADVFLVFSGSLNLDWVRFDP